MALIVEDGTGLATAESFATVAEGDAYAANRLYSTDWTGATTGNKEAALKMSTRLIDAAVVWTGLRKTEVQALGWPRMYAPKQALADSYFPLYYDDASVPKGVKDATCELAILLLQGDRTADSDSKGLRGIGLGSGAVTIDFDSADAPEMIPEMVALLLRPFGSLVTGKGTKFINIVRV